jgi:hypothetical protein
MRLGSQSVPLQSGGDDTFLATVQEWERFPMVFGRAEQSAGDADGKKESPVVELMHGAEWYINGKYSGPRSFAVPPGLESFVGHYRADSVGWGVRGSCFEKVAYGWTALFHSSLWGRRYSVLEMTHSIPIRWSSSMWWRVKRD